MTYIELLRYAKRKLDNNEITLGEYEKLIKPLREEIRENVHGEWKDRNGSVIYPFWERYECSVCGRYAHNSNFCPNCGCRCGYGYDGERRLNEKIFNNSGCDLDRDNHMVINYNTSIRRNY